MGESSKLREVKAVITLRSGKEVDQPLPKTCARSKRGLNVTKKAFLTEQVSVIIQCKSPIKYKDPGCPTISINIGGTHVEKALLDLGASVNLLPYFVYKQLGLGELKPIAITLFLADRNGVMQLTFGNMTLELNIFHLYKRHLHPKEEEGLEEVCLINTLVEEHCDKNLDENLTESLGVLEEGLPEPSDVLAIMSPWRRRERSYPCSMRRTQKEQLGRTSKAREAKNRGSRAVQAVDLHISEEHGSHSITRDFWRYMPATSYLQVTSQKLARGKLVHLHRRRSLALPSVGSGSAPKVAEMIVIKNASWQIFSLLPLLAFQIAYGKGL
ncbi:hypothetical protein CK203_106893 [Vitis vinifera]|uniref:Aspartic peptidase DDI1-type domain-containing protein n=1 Tax=Vitis vinifera TaxID=29760 RepID=A0A438C4K9_VITVI|nr:hypothetical protein CK203_106893 [Vitis vinifera]